MKKSDASMGQPPRLGSGGMQKAGKKNTIKTKGSTISGYQSGNGNMQGHGEVSPLGGKDSMGGDCMTAK